MEESKLYYFNETGMKEDYSDLVDPDKSTLGIPEEQRQDKMSSYLNSKSINQYEFMPPMYTKNYIYGLVLITLDIPDKDGDSNDSGNIWSNLELGYADFDLEQYKTDLKHLEATSDANLTTGDTKQTINDTDSATEKLELDDSKTESTDQDQDLTTKQTNPDLINTANYRTVLLYSNYMFANTFLENDPKITFTRDSNEMKPISYRDLNEVELLINQLEEANIAKDISMRLVNSGSTVSTGSNYEEDLFFCVLTLHSNVENNKITEVVSHLTTK